MALNLQKHLAAAGQSLMVHNRSPGKATEIVAAGGTEAKDVDEVFSNCSIVFSMVFDDAALLEVAKRVADLSTRTPSLIYVSCATVDPETMAKASAILSSVGATLVACPVFGRPDAARNKLLVGVLAGPPAAKAAVRPFVDGFTRAVWDQGDRAELANVMKVAGNFMLASTLEVISEAMAIADAGGLPREKLLDFVGLFMPSPALKAYATNIAQENFQNSPEHPGFPVRGGIKDVSLALGVAARAGQRLAVGEVVKKHFESRVTSGAGELDWASVLLAVKEDRLDGDQSGKL
ncbi:hypothetical protein DFJ74DRAFT_612922 [Hyaloraphidium curvatum]|nr:hypothetical protein DFJ74DRAFT_612922 [Hyaloraphidium curvatum]